MPATGKSNRPTVTLLGEMFPADPVMIAAMLDPLGLAVGPTVPCREWRELYSALDCGGVAAMHPFYTASVREFEAAGRPVFGSAPVGVEGTNAWLESVGDVFGIAEDKVALAKNKFLSAIKGALSAAPINGTITLSGYEGSELLVARLLIESGASIPYVGTACPRTKWTQIDQEWLESRGTKVKFRASLEDDCAAMEAIKPDLAVGTTPVVQKGKELGIPSLYFTNLISARPLMGPAGAGSLAEVVNAAMGNKDRMNTMKSFFSGVGKGDTAGIWEGTPNVNPTFRAHQEKKLEKRARAAKASEMI
jgi:chlorophyllide a reductase subunit Y